MSDRPRLRVVGEDERVDKPNREVELKTCIEDLEVADGMLDEVVCSLFDLEDVQKAYKNVTDAKVATRLAIENCRRALRGEPQR